MNGVRSTYMRKGYLLTALAAAVLLAASSGTAYAQRVTIGFVGASGSISEKAFLDANSLENPQRITVRVNGLLAGSRREGDIGRSLGNVTITPNKLVYIGRVTASGAYAGGAVNPSATTTDPLPTTSVGPVTSGANGVSFTINNSHFSHDDEVVLVVAQAPHAGDDAGTPDGNWLDERVALVLEVQADATAPASVNPDTFTLTVMESHVAPVAEFEQPDFTLSEESVRDCGVGHQLRRLGFRLPFPSALAAAPETSPYGGNAAMISVRVSNHKAGCAH